MLIPSFLTGLINSAGNIVAKVIHRHGTADELSGEVPVEGEIYLIEQAGGNYEPRMGDGSTVLGHRLPVAHGHGTYGWTWLWVDDIPSDGETLTIGDDVYEMDTNSSVTEGNIAVDISGVGADKDAVRDAIVSAISSSATESVKATNITADSVVYIFATEVGTAGNLEANESFASASIALKDKALGASSLVGGTDPQECACLFHAHEITSHDVALLNRIIIPVPYGTVNGVESDYETRLINMQATWTDVGGADQGSLTVTYVRDLDTGDRVEIEPAAGSFSSGDFVAFMAWVTLS